MQFQHTLQANRLAENASKYVGIKEEGNNRGAFVDMINRYVGNPLGAPYCAAFGYWNIKETNAIYPTVKSGLAVKYITNKSIKALAVAKGYIKLDSNKSYIGIYERGKTIHGHFIIVEKQINNNTIQTIEANTSSGVKGSQDDGDGIYRRTRKIRYQDYFKLVAFTEVKY